MNDSTPYSREEIELLGNSPPERGEYCSRCGIFIPSFADLSEEAAAEIRKRPSTEQIKVLRELTGCSLTWGKIWATHPHGANDPDPTVPCPYCGVSLKPEAKQCLLCKMNWHDPDRPYRSSASIAQKILDAPKNSSLTVRGYGVHRHALEFVKAIRPDDGFSIELEPRR